jgi:hypothetical protein
MHNEGIYHRYNGLFGSHVDNLLIMGNPGWVDKIKQVIEKYFGKII